MNNLLTFVCFMFLSYQIQTGFDAIQNSPVCEHARAALDTVNHNAAEKKNVRQ